MLHVEYVAIAHRKAVMIRVLHAATELFASLDVDSRLIESEDLPKSCSTVPANVVEEVITDLSRGIDRLDNELRKFTMRKIEDDDGRRTTADPGVGNQSSPVGDTPKPDVKVPRQQRRSASRNKPAPEGERVHNSTDAGGPSEGGVKTRRRRNAKPSVLPGDVRVVPPVKDKGRSGSGASGTG